MSQFCISLYPSYSVVWHDFAVSTLLHPLWYFMCICNLCDSVKVKCNFYLSVSCMRTYWFRFVVWPAWLHNSDSMIGVRIVQRSLWSCCLFTLQSWYLNLREGHRLRVFNISVVRKLVPNIHEVTGRLVKLHCSFVSCLNQIFLHWSNNDLVAVKGLLQSYKKLSWRRKKEYLVEFCTVVLH